MEMLEEEKLVWYRAGVLERKKLFGSIFLGREGSTSQINIVRTSIKRAWATTSRGDITMNS